MTFDVRTATDDDVPAIRSVVARAFAAAEQRAAPVEEDGVPGEATLVGWLRREAVFDPRFELVGVRSGEVVGHVIASWGDLGGVPVLGVGPLAVSPDAQGRGLGSLLMRELLYRAEDAGEQVVVLLGDPEYYARFGFVPAASVGIMAEPEWGEYFQACLLGNQPLTAPKGRYTYAEPFSRLS